MLTDAKLASGQAIVFGQISGSTYDLLWAIPAQARAVTVLEIRSERSARNPRLCNPGEVGQAAGTRRSFAPCLNNTRKATEHLYVQAARP